MNTQQEQPAQNRRKAFLGFYLIGSLSVMVGVLVLTNVVKMKPIAGMILIVVGTINLVAAPLLRARKEK